MIKVKVAKMAYTWNHGFIVFFFILQWFGCQFFVDAGFESHGTSASRVISIILLCLIVSSCLRTLRRRSRYAELAIALLFFNRLFFQWTFTLRIRDRWDLFRSRWERSGSLHCLLLCLRLSCCSSRVKEVDFLWSDTEWVIRKLVLCFKIVHCCNVFLSIWRRVCTSESKALAFTMVLTLAAGFTDDLFLFCRNHCLLLLGWVFSC